MNMSSSLFRQSILPLRVATVVNQSLNYNSTWISTHFSKIVQKPREINLTRILGHHQQLCNQYHTLNLNHLSTGYFQTKQKPADIPVGTFYKEFLAEFPNVMQDVTNLEGFECMAETQAWMKKVMEYNVPHGNFLRPMLLISTAKEAQKKSGKNLPDLYRIAWGQECLHACGIVVDDIIDSSILRRKRPCWYLIDNLGPAAINDGLFLENVLYALLQKYCKEHYSLYQEILELFHYVTLKSIHGQNMDLRLSNQKQFKNLTMDIYSKIATLKSGYYSFYAPIVLGLLLNEIHNPEILKSVEGLACKFAFLFSMQDDFIDYVSDTGKSHKNGTDIQNGKPSWLFITALERANETQRRILLDNYGASNLQNVAKVKNVYEDLNIPGIYLKEEKASVDNLTCVINDLPEEVPKANLHQVVSTLFGRSR